METESNKAVVRDLYEEIFQKHHLDLVDRFLHDDYVQHYNTITGTHTGEGFLGRPPTGRKIEYDVVDMFRLRDGKLSEHWDVAENRALFLQVGAIQETRRP